MDASFLASVDGLPANELRTGVNGELGGRILSKTSLFFRQIARLDSSQVFWRFSKIIMNNAG
jgi:hypothetical protein